MREIDFINVHDKSSDNTERLKAQGFQRAVLTAEVEPRNIRQDETVMMQLHDIVGFPASTVWYGATGAYHAQKEYTRGAPPDVCVAGVEDPALSHSYLITFNSNLVKADDLDDLAIRMGGTLEWQ